MVALTTACADANAPRVAASLKIAPDTLIVPLDSFARAVATVTDAGGAAIEMPVAWASTDTTVADVVLGNVAGIAVGAAEVIATVGSLSARIPVRVVVKLSQVVAAGAGVCGLGTSGYLYCLAGPHTLPGTRPGLLARMRGHQRFTKVSLGESLGCALTATGAAWCWTWADPLAPGPAIVPGGNVFQDISVGRQYACGLTAAGAILCWGTTQDRIFGGSQGQGVINPVPSAPGMTFRAISAGYNHVCGISTAGPTYCWGSNIYGATGDTSRTLNCTPQGPCTDHPVAVQGLPALNSLEAGANFTCGLTASGDGWCWGDGWRGEIGDSVGGNCFFAQHASFAYPCSETAVQVRGNKQFARVAVGVGHACGLMADGSAWCWGEPSTTIAQTGVPTNGQYLPALVPGGLHFTTLSASSAITCGMVDDQRAYCWYGGQLSPGPVLYQP